MRRPFVIRHTKRNIVLASLLALLCIGAAELAACRHFEPEIYERIVSPVRYAAGVVADTGKAGLDAAAQFCRNTADNLSQFASDTAAQAAAFWEELTTPKAAPGRYRPPAKDEPNPSAVPTVPPITELRRVGNRDILTGGVVDIVYFCQSAPEWTDAPYGTDTIGPYGCGPTAMAMAVASLTDIPADPATMAAWAVANGHWARRSGSRHSIVQGAAAGFGIEAESFPSREAEDMLAALEQGKLLVALVGPGHFTDGGHFILLRGVTDDRQVLVADPNSPERSLMLWDPQIVLDELSSARDNGAPLWVLSPPGT